MFWDILEAIHLWILGRNFARSRVVAEAIWLKLSCWSSLAEAAFPTCARSFRGEVGVVLFNHGAEKFLIKKGDRVAQMVLERISNPSVLEVDSLDETHRGTGGFGSTGV